MHVRPVTDFEVLVNPLAALCFSSLARHLCFPVPSARATEPCLESISLLVQLPAEARTVPNTVACASSPLPHPPFHPNPSVVRRQQNPHDDDAAPLVVDPAHLRAGLEPDDGRGMECIRADPERAPGLMLTSVLQCCVSAPRADIVSEAATTGHSCSSSRREAGQTALRQSEGQPCRATAGGAARCFGCLAPHRGHDVAAVRRGKRRRTMRFGCSAQLDVLGSDAPLLSQVAIIPTDTLPAFVCDVSDSSAVERLYYMKEMSTRWVLQRIYIGRQ